MASANLSGLTEADVMFLHRLGRQIRSERRRRQFTQRQLATRAGMSRDFLSLVERGGTGFDVLRLAHIAEALDMSPAKLLLLRRD